MSVYYNEFDPKAAAWLRELIANDLIPDGDVDERSIEDVRPTDLHGYTQCHFFAGIGGWAYALDLAGWPRDRPVWTGSCPCQPFSAAGKGAGFADERHLWPAWQHLIAQCRPPVVFGEQVASKDADPWIDLVQSDLEGMGYAFGGIAFPAASIGAPHIRDRTYWGGRLADADDEGRKGRAILPKRPTERAAGASGVASWLADAYGWDTGTEWQQRSRQLRQQSQNRSPFMFADDPCEDADNWRNADWLGCSDGKWRPVRPGSFPLANGLSARMVRLRAYGNAIVPQQAAEFIRAYLESRASVAVAT